ncbi:hypothetical protein ACQ4WX_48740 [Streptomyces lasalocidi]
MPRQACPLLAIAPPTAAEAAEGLVDLGKQDMDPSRRSVLGASLLSVALTAAASSMIGTPARSPGFSTTCACRSSRTSSEFQQARLSRCCNPASVW